MKHKSASLSAIIALLAASTAHAAPNIAAIEYLIAKNQNLRFLDSEQTELLAYRILHIINENNRAESSFVYGEKYLNVQNLDESMDLSGFDNLALRVYLSAMELQPNRDGGAGQ